METKKYSVEDFDYYINLLTLNVMKGLDFSFDKAVYSKEEELAYDLGAISQNGSYKSYNTIEHEIGDIYLSTLKTKVQNNMHKHAALFDCAGGSTKKEKKQLAKGVVLTTAGTGVLGASVAVTATGQVGTLAAAAAASAGAIAGSTAVAGAGGVTGGASWLGAGVMSLVGGSMGGGVAGGVVTLALYFAAPIAAIAAVGVGGTLTAKYIHKHFKKNDAELINKYLKENNHHIIELVFSLSALCTIEKLRSKGALEALDDIKIYRFAQKASNRLLKNLVKQVKKKKCPELLYDALFPEFLLPENVSSEQYSLKARELAFRHWLGALEPILKSYTPEVRQNILEKLRELRQKAEHDLTHLKNQKNTITESKKQAAIPFHMPEKKRTFFSLKKAEDPIIKNDLLRKTNPNNGFC